MAFSRVICRTRTMSSCERMGRTARLTTGMLQTCEVAGAALSAPLRGPPLVKAPHASLDIERRSHTLEPQSQFNECNRDGRLHSNHYRLCIQHAGHGRDIADHPADEGVNHLQRGDVEEDPACPYSDD